MKLTFEQIREMITGAVRIWEEDGLLKMCRFTEAQERLYETVSPEFHIKSLSSAGMRLMFRTDSRFLTLSVVTERGSTRRFFSYDVFVDGKLIAMSIVSVSVTGVGQVHFEKALTDYVGAYPAINRLTAQEFLAHTSVINRQEDMGDEGLRKAKLSYHPIYLAEKYRIRRR